jgi:hypothetical protein
MQARKLEELSGRLYRLRDQINDVALPDHTPLDESSALVQAARECEFMLPEPLTVATLAETVNHKIDNVNVLLERARKHEALPQAAQVAADQEYTVTEEDLLASRREQVPLGNASSQR